MGQKQIECVKDESLEDVIKTLKDMIAQAEDKMKHITDGKTAK